MYIMTKTSLLLKTIFIFVTRKKLGAIEYLFYLLGWKNVELLLAFNQFAILQLNSQAIISY